MKIQDGKGVNVDVHISVDSSTSVIHAHQIASDARAAVFDLDPCIDDATVHVDAQPISSQHGGEQLLNQSNVSDSKRRRSNVAIIIVGVIFIS